MVRWTDNTPPPPPPSPPHTTRHTFSSHPTPPHHSPSTTSLTPHQYRQHAVHTTIRTTLPCKEVNMKRQRSFDAVVPRTRYPTAPNTPLRESIGFRMVRSAVVRKKWCAAEEGGDRKKTSSRPSHRPPVPPTQHTTAPPLSVSCRTRTLLNNGSGYLYGRLRSERRLPRVQSSASQRASVVSVPDHKPEPLSRKESSRVIPRLNVSHLFYAVDMRSLGDAWYASTRSADDRMTFGDFLEFVEHVVPERPVSDGVLHRAFVQMCGEEELLSLVQLLCPIVGMRAPGTLRGIEFFYYQFESKGRVHIAKMQVEKVIDFAQRCLPMQFHRRWQRIAYALEDALAEEAHKTAPSEVVWSGTEHPISMSFGDFALLILRSPALLPLFEDIVPREGEI